MFQILDTHTLAGLMRETEPASNYWRSNFVGGNALYFDSEYIDFDTVDKGRRLAPFVAPNVAGRAMTEQGYATRRFKPAYIKPKTVVQPDRVLKRRAGEPYTGVLSPDQRRNAIVADILQDHKDMIVRRLDWMAAQATITGSVVISGEDYPEVTIAFGRHNDHTITLSNTDLWSDTTNSNPIKKLEEVCLMVQRRSTSPVNDLVFGVDAWAAFALHPKVQGALETKRGSTLTMETATGIGFGSEVAQYKGQLPNGPRLWVYNDVYENNSGADVAILNSKFVVGVGRIEGIRAFGAILDGRAGYRSLEMFPKMWEENDPAVETIMTQSAPLMIPRRPNASFRMQVLS